MVQTAVQPAQAPVLTGPYFAGTGKRKTSVARVKLFPTLGREPVFYVNGLPIEEYFKHETWLILAQEPFKVTDTVGQFSVVAKIEGGGKSSQLGALRHGIARALVAFNENLRPALRRAGLLTRDPRVKERKKYGLKRARRAPQFTKR